MRNRTRSKSNRKFAIVNGGAAGNITVPGIAANDVLDGVFAAAFTINANPPADNSPIDLTASAGDLTAEFSITAAATINNTGGTSTANHILFVWYYDVDA